MITTNTLGDLIDQGYTLTAHCEANPTRCTHSVELDLVALAARLGRDHSTMHKYLSPKLVCSKCGARGPGFILGAPNGYSAMAARGGRGFEVGKSGTSVPSGWRNQLRRKRHPAV